MYSEIYTTRILKKGNGLLSGIHKVSATDSSWPQNVGFSQYS